MDLCDSARKRVTHNRTGNDIVRRETMEDKSPQDSSLFMELRRNKILVKNEPENHASRHMCVR